MAIVGNYNKVAGLLGSNRKIHHVLEYLISALDSASEVHQRIFSNQSPSLLKIDIGHGCFALEQVFYTKEREECFFETHKKYIDFQLLLDGKEQMELIDKDSLVYEKYDEEKDFAYYQDTDEATKLVLRNGEIAIFFPDDAHMGLPKFKEQELVYKTVVKVPVKLFDDV